MLEQGNTAGFYGRRGIREPRKEHLRAGANSLLTTPSSGQDFPALDVGAQRRPLRVVQELVILREIADSGGAEDGVQALRLAPQHQHVGIMDIMVMLADTGVIDTGIALVCAAAAGSILGRNS